MKKLITSTLLTVAAVPFLMAAPSAAKKAQNSAPAQTTTSAKPKVHKKNVKKNKTAAASTGTAAPKK